MSNIQIFTDTGSDLTNELKNEGVKIVPLYISFDGKKSLKQMEEITLEEFYQKMREPHEMHPKTSLASIQDYYDLFEPSLKEGKDVIYLVMNGKFSSTMGAAINAKEMLEEDYPGRRVEVVDSKAVTYGQYYLAHIANEMTKENKEIDEIVSTIERLRETVKFFFTVETLDYLRDGGRIGAAAALLGGVLNVKPVMLIEDGEIKPVSVARGRNKSLNAILDEAKKYLDGKDVSKYEIAILEGDIYDEAVEFRKIVEEELKAKDLPISKLSISIGLHAGPGTMGIGVIERP